MNNMINGAFLNIVKEETETTVSFTEIGKIVGRGVPLKINVHFIVVCGPFLRIDTEFLS